MSQFVDNAANIFSAAESAAAGGAEVTPMAILITESGAIRMVTDCDWPLESLQRHHGARMAYKVSQQDDLVRVQGRADGRTCMFESATAASVSRQLLGCEKREYALRPASRLLAAPSGVHLPSGVHK